MLPQGTPKESKNKMKKILIAILFLLATGTAFSQVATVARRSTESAPIFSCIFTDVDSIVATNVYTSDWFDISAMQSQSLYLADSLYSPATTTADTVLVILRGRYQFGKEGTTTKQAYIRCDTITVFSNVVAVNTMSLSTYAPEVQFEIRNKTTTVASQNRNNKKLYLNLFSNTTNYLRPHPTYGNLP